MDFVVSGTLHTRTKVCGRANCRCAQQKSARHGPYYEWSRRRDGRLAHSVVTHEQAEWLAKALENHREIQRLLRLWEAESAQEVLRPDEDDESQRERIT